MNTFLKSQNELISNYIKQIQLTLTSVNNVNKLAIVLEIVYVQNKLFLKFIVKWCNDKGVLYHIAV